MSERVSGRFRPPASCWSKDKLPLLCPFQSADYRIREWVKETVAPFPLHGYVATATGTDGQTAGQDVPLGHADSVRILRSSGDTSLLVTLNIATGLLCSQPRQLPSPACCPRLSLLPPPCLSPNGPPGGDLLPLAVRVRAPAQPFLGLWGTQQERILGLGGAGGPENTHVLPLLLRFPGLESQTPSPAFPCLGTTDRL